MLKPSYGNELSAICSGTVLPLASGETSFDNGSAGISLCNGRTAILPYPCVLFLVQPITSRSYHWRRYGPPFQTCADERRRMMQDFSSEVMNLALIVKLQSRLTNVDRKSVV